MRKDQRVTVVLGAIAGVLAALAVAQQFGLGSGYSLLPPAPPPERVAASAPKVEGPKLQTWEMYADLIQRPMFNEDRKPTPPPGEKESGGSQTVQPLAVTLTGIILTNGVKLAMVRDNASGKSLRLRVGMALPGEQSGWKVADVLARSAVFEGAGQRQEIKLQVNDKGSPMVAPPIAAVPQPPPQPANPGQPAQPQPQPAVAGTQPDFTPPPAANADEIRRRIEERRKQLREDAQRMANQDQKQ